METRVCTGCGEQFVATARYLEISAGLCRSCATGGVEKVARTCEDCGGQFFEYPSFLRKIGAFSGERKRCPKCADIRHGKDAVDTVEARECLAMFPVARIETDLEGAEKLSNAGRVSGRLPRRAIIRDVTFPERSDGRLTVYDYRADGSRGNGSLALVRLMYARHQAGCIVQAQSPEGEDKVLEYSPEFQYLVLEDLEPKDVGKDPEVTLRLLRQDEALPEEGTHFRYVLTSHEPEEGLVGLTIAAIVDL